MTSKNDNVGLTKDDELVIVFLRQIRDRAFSLQYGVLNVSFKVRDGKLKEAHITLESEKLRPF